jgi:hypothetical protein
VVGSEKLMGFDYRRGGGPLLSVEQGCGVSLGVLEPRVVAWAFN